MPANSNIIGKNLSVWFFSSSLFMAGLLLLLSRYHQLSTYAGVFSSALRRRIFGVWRVYPFRLCAQQNASIHSLSHTLYPYLRVSAGGSDGNTLIAEFLFMYFLSYHIMVVYIFSPECSTSYLNIDDITHFSGDFAKQPCLLSLLLLCSPVLPFLLPVRDCVSLLSSSLSKQALISRHIYTICSVLINRKKCEKKNKSNKLINEKPSAMTKECIYRLN